MVARARAKAGDRDGLAFVVADAAEPPLAEGGYDVVLSRHVLWAMPDPETAFARWVGLLGPDGVVVLVEGSWHTGAGLTAAECERIVRTVRTDATVRHLTEPVYWGRPIDDERYLLVSRA
jgi:SAM-dependent methyltransferase